MAEGGLSDLADAISNAERAGTGGGWEVRADRSSVSFVLGLSMAKVGSHTEANDMEST